MAVAPPSRTARVAVLGSSVQRSKPTPYPSKARSALIRRAIVVGLVLVALALLTISFRSPTAGALHDVQGAGSTALRPFQVAATGSRSRSATRYDYVTSLASAKSENAKLQARARDVGAQRRSATARRHRRRSSSRSSCTSSRARRSRTDYRAGEHRGHLLPERRRSRTRSTIAAGSSAGVRLNTPVVSGDGLVGIVSNVQPQTAVVTLLTDPRPSSRRATSRRRSAG